jgi:hypothetical protein
MTDGRNAYHLLKLVRREASRGPEDIELGSEVQQPDRWSVREKASRPW